MCSGDRRPKTSSHRRCAGDLCLLPASHTATIAESRNSRLMFASHSLAGKPTVFQIVTISSRYSFHNYLKTHSQDTSRQRPSDKKKNKTDDLFSFADGVGDDQQSGLRCSHVPQHERLGFGVEAGNLLSLQLLAQVSTPGRPRTIPCGVSGALVTELVNSIEPDHPVTTARAAGLRPTLAALFCAEL